MWTLGSVWKVDCLLWMQGPAVEGCGPLVITTAIIYCTRPSSVYAPFLQLLWYRLAHLVYPISHISLCPFESCTGDPSGNELVASFSGAIICHTSQLCGCS